jgi:hypothetical protein
MTRTIAIIAVLVAGVCTTAMNWRFSYQLSTSALDSYTWATFSVALDVSKWLMLPFAAIAWRDHKLRSLAALAIWFVATIYSFTAAIGFAAINRETAISERLSQVDLRKTLELMKQSPRWQSSAACSDATTVFSKEFCARYNAVQIQLKDEIGEADPQSALFARITDLSPDKVRVILAVFLAIACEVISALGFFAIMPPSPKPQAKSATTAVPWRPATWPVTWLRKKPNAAPLRTVSRRSAT